MLRAIKKIIRNIKKQIVEMTGISALDQKIKPEILDDAFYRSIKAFSQLPQLTTFLEIGSSSGDGSTKAFVEGIRDRTNHDDVRFCCMEVSTTRFANLKKAYGTLPFVYPFNVSSIGTNEFPAEADVEAFYRANQPDLSDADIKEALGWLQQDMDYILETGRDFNGISAIKQRLDIETFDLVVIDGSEFTGDVELGYLLGAKVILLDDTETYKCWNAREQLMANSDYQLLYHEPNLRNGFAMFAKKSFVQEIGEENLPVIG